jgi:hypothetical protein
VLLFGLFVSEVMQGVEAFVKFELRDGVVNTTLGCYDVIIDRDSVRSKAVISNSFPPVSNSPQTVFLYHKMYTFVQHIYNFLQSIHRLHVSALLGHHQALYMKRFLRY